MSNAVQGFSSSVDDQGFPIWISPDGFSVRKIAGGDGTDDNSEEKVEESEEDQGSDEGESEYSYSSDFLTGIDDEEQRQLLEPYVKKWDAGVTRKFQELHAQYEPYQSLGDPEELQQYVELVEYINNDPQGFYKYLGDALGVSAAEAQKQVEEPDPVTAAIPDELQRALDPYKTQLTEQEQLLRTMGEYLLQQQQEAIEAQEDMELENYLSELEKEFGSFDADYVLTKMANGVDGADAVKAYKQSVQEYVNTTSKKKPSMPVLGGGGSIPSDEEDITKLDSGAVKNLVAGLIQQSVNNQ